MQTTVSAEGRTALWRAGRDTHANVMQLHGGGMLGAVVLLGFEGLPVGDLE